jgi:hypothetical protein
LVGSNASVFNHKFRHGGLDFVFVSRSKFYLAVSELKKVKKLEEENAKLKRMYADLALELDMAKYIIEKKL